MSGTVDVPAPAPFDAVDLAFLRRLAGRAAPRAAIPDATAAPLAGAGPAAPPVAACATPDTAASPTVAAAAPGTLVDRLLTAVPEAWIGLAQRVEEKHRGGAIVFAVTGARRGAGRTTIVACLSRVLSARGHDVTCVASAPLEPTLLGRGRPPIVLVDAGVWFPGGPLRRGWIERQSLGCHAVILVRRADEPPCPARGAALAAVGLEVVGEVVTMVPPGGMPGATAAEAMQ